ncbi:MAG: TetR family transcriptional regulator [Pseudomonadota bacterium]
MKKSVQPTRNAEATTERILLAAQRVFHEKGYDGATTREIADEAGINLTLINRYFGSKLGLFEKAVLPHLDLEPYLKGTPDDIARSLSELYIDTGPKGGFDAFVVLVRSIASKDAGPLLMARLQDHALDPLMNILEGPNKLARATLISTQLAGLVLRFRIMSQLAIDDHEQAEMKRLLQKQLHSILTVGEK